MTPHSGHTGAPVRVTEGQKKRWRDYWTHTSFHCSSSFCSFSWAITSLQWLKDLSLHTSPASLLFSAWRSSNTSFWIKQTDHCLNVTKKGLGHTSRKSTEQIILCIRKQTFAYIFLKQQLLKCSAILYHFNGNLAYFPPNYCHGNLLFL